MFFCVGLFGQGGDLNCESPALQRVWQKFEDTLAGYFVMLGTEAAGIFGRQGLLGASPPKQIFADRLFIIISSIQIEQS